MVFFEKVLKSDRSNKKQVFARRLQRPVLFDSIFEAVLSMKAPQYELYTKRYVFSTIHIFSACAALRKIASS